MDADLAHQITTLLKTNGPLKVSRDLGVSLVDVLSVQHPTSTVVPIKLIPKGRPELQKYIVAMRLVFDPWPVASHVARAQARADYDAGKVEMCQGRDGPWIIQYAIPRKVPTRARYGFEIR